MNFPPEWLDQQRGLIQNILSQEVQFGEKLEVVIRKLNEKYDFPIQGLLEQKRLNQSTTTQGIVFSISSAISNPDEASIIIKGMLTESQRCRNYESKFKKYESFFKKVYNSGILDSIDTLNLNFKNQVIIQRSLI